MFLGVHMLSFGTGKGSDFIAASGFYSLSVEAEDKCAVLLILHLFLLI